MLDASPKLITPAQTAANTFGWDTVFGIAFTDANQAIVNEGSSPNIIDYVVDDGGDPPVIIEALEGNFGDWSITGGSGQLLEMTAPLPEVTMKMQGQADVIRRNVTVRLEVQLDQISDSSLRTSGQIGTPVAFRLWQGNGGGTAVSVLSVDYPQMPPDVGFPGQPASQDEPGGFIPADMQNMFSNWINDPANIGKFDHTFAVVNLNARIPDEDPFDWLAPTSVAYGVASDGLGGGLLAILCMTQNRPAPGNQDVTQNLLPADARAGFLISKEMYMRNMLLPGLSTFFDDPGESGKSWPLDYFEVTAGGTRIHNTAPLGISEFEVGEEINDGSIAAGGFTAELEDTWLRVYFDRFRHSYWKGWYDVYHDIRIATHIGLTEDKKNIALLVGSGEADADGNDINPPMHFATVEKTKLAKDIETALLIIDAVLVLVSLASIAKSAVTTTTTAVTDASLQSASKVSISVAGAGAGEAADAVQLARGGATVLHGSIAGVTQAQSLGMRWLSGIYYAMMGALGLASAAALIENVFQEILNSKDEDADDNVKNALPDVGAFATMVMEPITWPGVESGFELTSCQFNGGVQMGGNPTFADPTT